MFSRVRARRAVVRLFSSEGTKERVVPAATKQRNVAVALGLLGFVGGIYYTAISKMKQGDDLTAVLEQEVDTKPKK